MIVSKKKSVNTGLCSVKCFCGDEILLLPSVRVMNEAIELHVAKHLKKINDPKGGEAEAERIRDDLISKIFEKASQE